MAGVPCISFSSTIVAALPDSLRHLPPEVSGLQHSHSISIVGHFSAHGMPDGPSVVPSACGLRAL